MSIRNPIDRNDLSITKNDKVVEFGPGHNPSFRANVLVEKFIDDNSHRSGTIKMFPHQRYFNEDGERTHFSDKEFDYSICNQVLEHVNDPAAFLKEQMRIAKGGYIETPSLIGEYLFPKKSHKWAVLKMDGKLIFYEKSKIHGGFPNKFGTLFLNYLPYRSFPYKLLWLSGENLMINRYEWKDSIDFIVNPTDDYYKSFFVEDWTDSMIEKVIPKRPWTTEICNSFEVLLRLVGKKMRRHHVPIEVPREKINCQNAPNDLQPNANIVSSSARL